MNQRKEQKLFFNPSYFTSLVLFTALCSSAVIALAETDIFWNIQLSPLFFQLSIMLVTLITGALIIRCNQHIYVNVIDILITLYSLYVIFNIQDGTSAFVHSNGVYFPVCYLCIYFLVKYWASEYNRIRYIVTPFVLFGLVNIAICILQLGQFLSVVNPYFSINGTFLNPSQLGGYLMCLTPMLYFLFKTNNLRRDSFYFLLSAFLIFIALSESRSALVGLLALVVFEVFSFFNSSKKVKTIGISVIILIPLSVFLYKIGPESVKGRLLVWKVGLEMAKVAPFTGLGHGSVKSDYPLYQAAYFSTENRSQEEKLLAGNTTYLFNEPLEILVEQGIFGFLIFCALTYVVISKIYKRHLKYFKYSILGILIFGFWSYPFDTPAINLVFYASFGILSNYALNTPSLHITSTTSSRLIFYFVLPFSILSSFSIGITIAKTFSWREIERLWQYNEEQGLAKQQVLKASLDNNSSFMYNYLAHLVNAHYYLEAIRFYEENTAFFHHNSNLHMMLGHLYEKANRTQESIFHYRLSSNIKPLLLVPKYRLFNQYLTIKNEKKATEIAKDIMLTPIKTPTQTAEDIKNEIEIFLEKKKIF